MYRSCIFCSAPLGSNESIERFPVGRSLAFDAAKGRLWAVCPRCARWNLAPIKERWQAIEEAEIAAIADRLPDVPPPEPPRIPRTGYAGRRAVRAARTGLPSGTAGIIRSVI